MDDERPHHVVVMDFDGTLIPKKCGSVFRIIEDGGGLPEPWCARSRELRARIMARASAGKLSDMEEREWYEKNIQYWIEGGLTLETMRRIYKNVKLRDGVLGALWFLKQRKIPVAIVSFGICDAIEMILHENGALQYISAIYAARLTADPRDGMGGRITGYEAASVVLPKLKGRCSRDFARAHGVPFRNILAVGDSGGDRYLGFHKRNRIAIAQDKADAARFSRFMGTVVVTEAFHPVTEWLAEKIKS